MSLPNRHSIRLKNYDYSSEGLYFVTICSHQRECIFGEIIDGKMVLNEFGKIIESVWYSLPDHYSVELDKFQIMPNHIHIIIAFVGAGSSRPLVGRENRAPTLGNIMAYFKYQSTKQINDIVGVGSSNPKTYSKIFQRNYYEHIIRNEQELNKIREYIKFNPKMWEEDKNNPENIYI